VTNEHVGVWMPLGVRGSVFLPSSGEIDYWTVGSGPPLVLVHGLLATALHWSLMTEQLAAHHTVIVPELPFGGHRVAVGPSVDITVSGQARLVAELIAALGLTGVTVVGNDTGGTVVQMLLTEHASCLAAAVISDCDAFDNLPPPIFRYLCWLARTPRLLSAAFRTLRALPFLQRTPFAFGWLTRRGVPPEISRVGLDLFCRPGPTRDDLVEFLRTVNSVPTMLAADRFAEVSTPCLIVWSRDDRVFPFGHAQRLAASIPGARLAACDGAGAYLPYDEPRWFADQIIEFAR
jgi:pimeloyl-ACP methyl ester carboxylesterase